MGFFYKLTDLERDRFFPYFNSHIDICRELCYTGDMERKLHLWSI